jgi:rhodanese-related sulfurtransferase
MADHARTHRALAVTAATLGALALAAGDPYPAGRSPAAARDVPFVTALDVARWIRERRPDLRIVDVRAHTLFDAYHIPGAERVALDTLSRRAWQPHESVVVYADNDAEATRAALALKRRGVANAHILRGGLLSWVDQIVEPHLATLPRTATPAEQAARREQLELSRYFGGTPRVSLRWAPGSIRRSQSETAAVARIIRRGC